MRSEIAFDESSKEYGPSITVITICFNNLPELIKTLQSVDTQNELPEEHWIIDGSDTTQIKSYLESTPQPSYRKWLCEPDKGIADAFNKGILKARGEFVNMLNSGDTFHNPKTLSIVKSTLAGRIDIQWLHGKYQVVRGGRAVVIGKPFDAAKLYRGMRSLGHQSMFVKRSLHDIHGLYDTGLNISMDYDFVCRISKEPFLFLSEVLIDFAPGGASQTQYLASLRQAQMVYEKYFGFSLKQQIWLFRLRVLYYLMRTKLGHWLYAAKVKAGMENL